ncbi:MAG TPA: FtsX-like permease family protein [Solirubrobacteraceae bacterium]|jgi:putative ABC transport system permease protein|nr:FtsX-like permease family protein [Solirubrobacteraceae bacterium]
MRPSTIFYLYRVRLRARLVQELLAVAGIAVGVALLFASQVANTSLSGSVTHLTNELVGTARLQIVARDPQGFSEGLVTEAERLSGVSVAAPLLERSINVVGPNGAATVDLIGVDRRFIQLDGPLLAHISAGQLYRQHGLALPLPTAEKIGVKSLQPLTAQIGARNVPEILALELTATDIGSGVTNPVAIMPLQAAQRLTGMVGRVSRILVEPTPGDDSQARSGLQRIAAGRLDVRPANFDASVFGQAEGPTVQSTELFSAISALVGFLFAFNAMLLTVPQRRNLITDLRLDGYTPVEILEVMLFDVVALGIVGTLVGLALGDFLSRSLLQAQPGYLSLAFPVGSQHVVNWQSVAIAAAGGLLAAVVGVIVPLRGEIFGYRPVGAHSRRGPVRVGRALGVAGGVMCTALTTAILLQGVSSVGGAVLAFASLTLALLLILPIAFSGAIALIDRVQRPVMGVSSRIALIELLSSTTRARSLSIAATGAIAVFGSVAIEGARGNLRDGLVRSAADLSLGTDLWVSPSGGATTLATTPFEDRYGHQLRRLPTVAGVDSYRGGFLDIGVRRVLVLAPPTSDPRLVSPTQIVTGELGLARLRLRLGHWVTLSQELADEHDLHVGNSFVLPAPRPTVFRVAAITTNFGWSPGTIVMNADDYAQAWQSKDVSAYQVALKPGVPIEAGLREVRSSIEPDTALVAQSAAQHEQNEIAGQRQGLARLTDIAALVLVAAALAMAAAMGAMLWQRRPRLAGMKVDGFGQGELWGALLWESALLLGTGCSIGAVFGLYGQLVLSHALVSVTGFPVVFSVGVSVAVVCLSIVTAIALFVVALPGYLAVQVKPALQE